MLWLKARSLTVDGITTATLNGSSSCALTLNTGTAKTTTKISDSSNLLFMWIFAS